MPRKEKKTREEKIAEEYFPVDETDVKLTTEKEEKELEPDLPKESVEKEYKRKAGEDLEEVEKVKKPKRKYSKKKIKVKKFTPPKIKLKDEGYELVITEKPQAASKIAEALGKTKRKVLNKVSYYEVDRGSHKIIVACAVGHLFTMAQNVSGYHVPIFDVDWMPNYLVRKKDFTKRYYDLISKLAKSAGSITVATDYDVEGEVIGLNVVRYITGQKDASRMKFSTLTSKELEKAYENKTDSVDWGQAIAGETRHYLDWFYGINLSRALMNAIKTTGSFKIMSIGRVQGPALNLIVQREREIIRFKPEPYWQVFITVKNDHVLELKHNKDIFDKKELDKFKDLKGRKVEAKTKKTEEKKSPNPPFNLTTLQTEAYKLFGITPSRTMQIAQSLYLGGLISYPRTSSQKLPVSVGYKEILDKLAKKYKVEHLIKKSKPIEGKKSDPAHPSIYPTGDSQILSGDDEKVYDLIVKRFLALFCDSAVIDKKTVSVDVNDLKFSTNGSSIRKKAWMEIYPSKLKEKEVPDLEGEVKIIKVKTEEKETQPPKRYSPASIISELEKRNLGTKATRSSILETLYDRGYIKEKSIEATPLGMSLITTMEKYSPVIIDEELTRKFENEMKEIRDSKNKDLEKKEEKVINEAKDAITKISEDFDKHENEIGKELLRANIEQREQEKEENKIMECPVCKKGSLAITYSPKFKRHFIACDAYPDCKTTFSLPPNGTIKKTEKVCDECGFKMMMSLRKGKKPWFFCFNPECPTNKERIEGYKKDQSKPTSQD